MFTGIIQERGKIQEIKDLKNLKQVTINCEKVLEGKKIGDSISINGICSTVTKIEATSFTAEYMKETLEITTAKNWKSDDLVNLEGSIKAGDTFDGHFVQGHVDCKGKLNKIDEAENMTSMEFSIPEKFSKFTAMKGSITVNGVSLTISKIEEGLFKVDLIPHTLKETNLGELKVGSEVNIEIDMIARYLKRLLDQKEDQVTYDFLRERNII